VKAAVIGSGVMGPGIAQAYAMAGMTVALHDELESALQTGLDGIRDSLARFIRSGKLSGAESAEVAARIHWLASDECSFTTGQCLDISGGRATY